MEDVNTLCQKILKSLEDSIKPDLNITEFSIIPAEDNTYNISPVKLEGGSVGLESWCVEYIYEYACKGINKIRRKLTEKKLRDKYELKKEINYLLTGALLINPDVITHWALKRNLVLREVLDINEEIHFTNIVLLHKPKSNEAFSYRRFLVGLLLKQIAPTDSYSVLFLFQAELNVTTIANNRSSNNYHSWNHRIWSVENLGVIRSLSMVSCEISESEKWIRRHVSEHSAYNYRQYLIKTLLRHVSMIFLIEYNRVSDTLKLDIKDRYDFISHLTGVPYTREIDENFKFGNILVMLLYDLVYFLPDLNSVFPGHESMWYHRRFLVTYILKVLHIHHNIEYKRDTHVSIIEDNPNDDNILNCDIRQSKLPRPSPVENCRLYKMLLNWEKDFLQHCMKDQNENTPENIVQMECAKRHKKWLKLILHLDCS